MVSSKQTCRGEGREEQWERRLDTQAYQNFSNSKIETTKDKFRPHFHNNLFVLPSFFLLYSPITQTVWIKAGNEARATVRVSVYIDLIGNFRSAELGMMEGWRVEK